VVSGQVIGDLTKADALLLGGQLTTFGPTELFSAPVPLGVDGVNIIEAAVESTSLGTENTDSVVVLKGAALPLTSRVPDGNHNRLNASAFSSIQGLVLGGLESQFSPAAFIGQQIQGGTITEFSVGAFETSILPANGSVALTIDIPNFHLKL